MQATELTLFTPTKVGPFELKHRVVLAPLTRMRADVANVPTDLMVEYYAQRATAGGLLIAEATAVSPLGIAYVDAPGIFNEAQAAGWKRVTDAVHAKGARIFLQLWHAGRQAHPANIGGQTPIAPSAIRAQEHAAIRDADGNIVEAEQVMPRALAIEEIPAVVESFRHGAGLAKAAGFDGVELHAANGYLLDQFLLDGSNHRTDAYGGPVENRARLLFEVLDAVSSVWGDGRVAVRLSPSGAFGTMSDRDPHGTFGYVATRLNHYALAYLHLVEPRVRGNEDTTAKDTDVSTRHLRPLYHGTIIAAGGFTRDSAEQVLRDGIADLVAFGRTFIANPDLPERLRAGAALNPYDRSTFYGGDARGYTDYAFLGDMVAAQ
ncbi:N-ethylmaleimide reductase [Cupriavidus gilardii J11]|uniref:N-ethylmaleimide reductase n=1 Tax=Cupriavidus gilardii J11 TaxID=936133 RepID=A0A562BV97_9BURK|nr:alkene reductase [Cupriavidus gilardii]TWG88879.1 N-ethylmaleimide reductase [Cupriavidus gilardii J11]